MGAAAWPLPGPGRGRRTRWALLWGSKAGEGLDWLETPVQGKAFVLPCSVQRSAPRGSLGQRRF